MEVANHMPAQVTAAMGKTDFSQYSHTQLVQMLFAGSPKSVKEAAETWASAGKYLHEQAGDVEQQLGEFSDKWAGGAAEQYKTMITDLNSGIRSVADTVLKVRDLTFSAAEALEEAQRTMPMPVDVPALAPSTVAMASTPLPMGDGYSTASMVDMQRRQADAAQAVEQHQQAQAAADAAHQQAIMVMTKLAGHYTATQQAMPATPTAASPPTLDNPATGHPPALVPGNSGATVDPIPPAQNGAAAPPLFSKMFGAGMAAASAALGGRFANVLPRLLGRGKEAKDKAQRTGTPTTTPGGAGGGGAGGGAPQLGGGGEATGNPAMAGGGGGASSGVNGLQTAAAGASGAAAAARPMGMVPPMMPFAPMGADGMGGGRRIPPWLVETEDVWGEPSVVAPPVIGEDRDAGTDNPNASRGPWS